mgnify:FL=1
MFEIKGKDFLLNGKKVNVYSGVMHYFRMQPEYWEDRLTKLKLCGFNTVETYMCWNLHEPKKGVYDFEGMLDIERYIEIAGKVGLNVIVRPGPYICAEWDFGGLPPWLLADRNIRLRCNNELFKKHVEDWYAVMFDKIRPHLESNGGNVIMMQVENEYGSFGNDYEYLEFVKELFAKYNMDVLLFTSDGNWCNMLSGGSLPSLYKVLNFGSNAKGAFGALDGFQKDMPLFCGEFWCGWFDHWGEKHHTRNSTSVVKEIEDFIAQDANFNVYMFYGGTNFGFWAGSNFERGKINPTTTSYDYCAFLTEWGDYTPAYHAVREVMHKVQGLEMLPLVESPKMQNIGVVKMTESAKLFDNLSKIGTKFRSATPESMEYFGQNYGFIYYETKIKGKYQMQPLKINGVHDIAHIYVDDKKVAVFDRNKKTNLLGMNKHQMFIGGVDGEKKIGILVDAMGRINYGEKLEDRKGIESVIFGKQVMFGYDVYCLPMDNLDKLEFTNQMANNEPVFVRGTFKANSKDECFVHMDNFGKGNVWINGYNIGRYWTKKGPQKALYIPGSLLNTDKENEIIIFDIEGYKNAEIVIDGKPDLGK